MPYKYIGRTTHFKGKSLWEILGNLKNFGVHRTVARHIFHRYPEPSYIKVKKVEALPNINSLEERRKVIALVEKIFRGIKEKTFVQMESSTYKTDYLLIHKYEESTYCQSTTLRPIRILPNKMEFPPLLEEFIIHYNRANGVPIVEKPKMDLKYNKYGIKMYQIATENEKPTEPEPTIGFGIPTSLRFLKNLKE